MKPEETRAPGGELTDDELECVVGGDEDANGSVRQQVEDKWKQQGVWPG